MRSGIKLIVSIAYVFITFPVPAEEILIKNASIHTLTGAGTLENADILIRNGSISALGTDIDSSSVGKVIDASDKQVTPGLINAYTYLGVMEISQLLKGRMTYQPGMSNSARLLMFFLLSIPVQHCCRII